MQDKETVELWVPAKWQSFATIEQIIAAYNKRRWLVDAEKPRHVKDDA